MSNLSEFENKNSAKVLMLNSKSIGNVVIYFC